jgi:phage gp36-like protein
VSQYCQTTDLPLYGAPATALSAIPGPTQTAQCIASSAFADSKLRARYQLPLQAWGTDLTMYTAIHATYMLLVTRGYNPAAGADPNLRQRFEDALAGFDGVERGNTHPDVTPSVAPGQDPLHDEPRVVTSPVRGWQQTRNGRSVVG